MLLKDIDVIICRFARALMFVACCTLVFGASADELSGTSWRLVKIMSMDDSVYAPDDPSIYTLDLQAEGKAVIQADCNRGTGSWTSEATGQLSFGPIASTRAMCPPGSISEKYMAQFEWVRSYVMKDGYLFLATMADGSIIEFEPTSTEPQAATVLGEEVRTFDAGQMQDVILTRLFDDYAVKHGIEAEPAEIDAFIEKMRLGMEAEELSAEDNLKPEEAEQVAAMRQSMARSMIRQWKINRALHEEYGGRIIYQQLGPEPLDAYRTFLEQRQREGAFAIHDQSLEEGFWSYFTNESIHDFMEQGGADEARAFSMPPWQQQ